MMAVFICVCSGEWKVDNVWEPLCIKAKPAATFMEEMAAGHERDVLQAVQSAMQALPGPHHLTYLLAYYPADGTELRWGHDQQEVWFVTE
jgi:hypothetical protein